MRNGAIFFIVCMSMYSTVYSMGKTPKKGSESKKVFSRKQEKKFKNQMKRYAVQRRLSNGAGRTEPDIDGFVSRQIKKPSITPEMKRKFDKSVQKEMMKR